MNKKLGEGTTPAPWTVAGEMYGIGNLRVEGVVKEHQPIANCGWDETGESKANARLIAKAPLLIEARDVLVATVLQLTACMELL